MVSVSTAMLFVAALLGGGGSATTGAGRPEGRPLPETSEAATPVATPVGDGLQAVPGSAAPDQAVQPAPSTLSVDPQFLIRGMTEREASAERGVAQGTRSATRQPRIPVPPASGSDRSSAAA